MTTAVMYLRVSSVGQAEDGYGLDVQEQACRALAEAHGLTIAQTCTDAAVRGTLPPQEREGLACALGAIRDGSADVLLVARLDRLARELTVQEAALALVWREGGRVYSADYSGEVHRDDPDDPMRTAMRQMAGVFAQLDRATTVKKLRDGRRVSAAKGGRGMGGRARFGFDLVAGALVPNEAEQAVIARVQADKAAGRSVRAIAAALNDEGVPTKRGGRWQPNTVQRLLDPSMLDRDAAREAAYRARDARLEGRDYYALRQSPQG